jgi:hypothetical protein
MSSVCRRIYKDGSNWFKNEYDGVNGYKKERYEKEDNM